MKKLEKLTLKEMEHEMPVIDKGLQKIINGGFFTNNDCIFEAFDYLASWLGCNDYGYSGWFDLYGQKFGIEAQVDALEHGVESDDAIDLLDDYFSVNGVTDFNVLGSGENLGFLLTENGGHAVLIDSYDSSTNLVTYFDPDLNAYQVASPSEFHSAFSVDCF
ncbi:MAG: hypothetical protein V2I31_08580 [Mariniphaga sp.]|jgi:hypothetical protein|nr:hypothetical protein [Mariniphaga sp.]